MPPLRALRVACLCVVVAPLVPLAGWACSTHSGFSGPPLAVNPFPGINPPPVGKEQGVVGYPIDVFAPQTPMTCVCGLGVGGGTKPKPGSLTVDQAVLTRYNPATGQHTILTEFVPLTLSSVTTQGLATGPGQLFPASQWFGFSGQIQPFDPPLLMPGEVFTLQFALSFDPADASQLPGLPIQFAAGAGDPSGAPDFDPRSEHPVLYFGATELPPCVPTDTALCLNGGRFKVEIDWEIAGGAKGKGRVAGCPTGDTGLFWFFHQDNTEMTIKVLNACTDPFQHYWVFFSALTDVGFTLTVTDTKVPRIKRYENPLGKPAAPVQDVEAFATCP